MREGDYLITHVGEGNFEIEMDNGEIKDAGSNLCGMIRYTYFDDDSLPPMGWSTTRLQLLEDYIPKIQKDLLNGKIDIE